MRIMIISILLLIMNYSTAQSWTEMGPFNRTGVMNQLFLDEPTKKLYASSPDGGVWVYDDFTNTGLNWRPITDVFSNLEIRAFTVAANNTVYVATKAMFMMKSTNGGTTWQPVNYDKSFGFVNVICVPYNDPLIIYLGTKTGLFKSTNGGSSWQPLLTSMDVLDIKNDPDSVNIVYAGIRNVGLKKTTNSGSDWGNAITWAATRDANSKAAQMIRIALGLKNSNNTLQTPSTRTVAVKFGSEVWVSYSGAATGSFSNANFNDNTTGGSSNRTDDKVAGDWNNAIAVNPVNPNELLVGQCFLWKGVRSSTGNFSWDTVTQTHEDHHDLVFSSTSSGVVFNANDGGVGRSTNSGNSFSGFNKKLNTSQFLTAGISGNVAVANMDHNGIQGSTDLVGGDWVRVVRSADCGYGNNTLESNNIYADPKRTDKFYMLFDNSLARIKFPFSGSTCLGNVMDFGPFTPYFQHDGAETADEFRNRISFPYGQIAVDTRNESNVMLAVQKVSASSHQIMYTNQANIDPTGGPRGTAPFSGLPVWNEVLTTTDDPIVSLKFAAPGSSQVYAITSKGVVYKRSFLALSLLNPIIKPVFKDISPDIQLQLNTIAEVRVDGWIKRANLSSLRPILHLEVNRTVDSILYAVSENAFHVSLNGGKSWTSRLRNIPVNNYYMTLSHPGNKDKVFLATSEGVYLTTNNGSTWTKVSFNLPNVKALQLYVNNGYLYACTYGRGIWRISLNSL